MSKSFVPTRLAAILIAATNATGQPLTSHEMAEAIAIGVRCEAPIIRLAESRADFEGYIESPFARVALVAATARLMHQPLDAPGVKRAMQRPGVRLWFARTSRAPHVATIRSVRIRSPAGDIAPVTERPERFFLGTVPSHGIVDALRVRFPEFVFEGLPAGSFDVVVRTRRGTRQFTVTQRDRTSRMRVCNPW